ncbi:uncharacterized protein LOC115624850 [Scaptodrosophila lebanonensis]|uniref:Uncharacterized protein LOC115624850 n=1 Tax=Drosophila lebanonensis TaxID=7225 RepID=A0A6J2TJC5_DROLE|nr:uncharacterized protein LOC115624850 [Scaptodrosophila lebanonensis]
MLKAFGTDVFDECKDVNERHFIGSNKSCAHYIFCNGEDSYDGECVEGDYFSAAEEMCEPMGNVDCRPNLGITVSPFEGNEVITIGAVMIPTIAQPSATSNTSGASIESIKPIVSNVCPKEDSSAQIVLVADHKSCSDYYICYHGEPHAMHCSGMLHFNKLTGKCDRAENVGCLVSATNTREQCRDHTIDVYPHLNNCNYFYYCYHGFLLLQQCPFSYGWDYEKRSCVVLGRAKCYDDNKIALI